jgi:cellobiose dehydrogenase (acceptor)
MVSNLLLMIWPYQNQILSSFRFADDYFLPPPYAGNATLTQLSSTVNATSYELIYRCQNCFAWNHKGTVGNVASSEGGILMGRALSNDAPEANIACPSTLSFGFHASGFGLWMIPIENATTPGYAKWAALPAKTVAGSCA